MGVLLTDHDGDDLDLLDIELSHEPSLPAFDDDPFAPYNDGEEGAYPEPDGDYYDRRLERAGLR